MVIKQAIRNSIHLVPAGVRSKIRKLPLIANLQRLLVDSLDGETFAHTIDMGPGKGLCINISLPADKELWKGTYEIEFISDLVSRIGDSTICYDIGGWRGYVSACMKFAGAAQVITFEPVPNNVNQINQLKAMNPGVEFELVEVAVGANNETTSFQVMPDSSMGKLSESSFQSDIVGNEITVPVRTLDSLVYEDGKPTPDLIKIDVEGAEVLVLQGATRTLTEAKPELFIEVHSGELHRQCSEILRDIGYDILSESRRDPVIHVHAVSRGDK